MKTKVAIIGAAGYSGEELLRILSRHPQVEITHITSRKNAGNHLSTVFPRFADKNLYFCQPDVAEIAKTADVVFLALPHGLAAEYALPFLEAGLTVFDLSADFRLDSLKTYEEYYGMHPAPQLLENKVYGAPEREREKIKQSNLIACPGCYPTSITLALCPLLTAAVIEPNSIVINSLSGVSGAGRKVDLAFIYPECNESARPYGVVGHRHVPEIEQELSKAASVPVMIEFIPHLIPLNRGILSTITATLKPEVDAEKITKIFQDAYANERFVRTLGYKKMADIKNVTLTNSCEIGFDIDPRTGRIIISSSIDNLTKGAAGQAVQAFNIKLGFAEETALL